MRLMFPRLPWFKILKTQTVRVVKLLMFYFAGVWYMHCHFERHQTWGMKMVFIVKDGDRPNEKMLPPPPDMPRCDTPPLQLLFRV